MYKLIYDEDHHSILQISPAGVKTMISDDFPSRPEYSPDQKKAIFISPLEWETPGTLYLYDLESGRLTELIKPDENDYIPKYAVWINNEIISIIIGYGMGTVSVGGNMFLFDTLTNQLKKITHYDSKIQVTKLTLDDSCLSLDGIEYTDKNLVFFREFNDKVSINEFL